MCRSTGVFLFCLLIFSAYINHQFATVLNSKYLGKLDWPLIIANYSVMLHLVTQLFWGWSELMESWSLEETVLLLWYIVLKHIPTRTGSLTLWTDPDGFGRKKLGGSTSKCCYLTAEKFLQVIILANQSLACIHFLLVRGKIEKNKKGPKIIFKK